MKAGVAGSLLRIRASAGGAKQQERHAHHVNHIHHVHHHDDQQHGHHKQQQQQQSQNASLSERIRQFYSIRLWLLVSLCALIWCATLFRTTSMEASMQLNNRNHQQPQLYSFANSTATAAMNLNAISGSGHNQKQKIWHPMKSRYATSNNGKPKYKFYVLPMPKITTDLIDYDPERATAYYERSLNEESAEIWLHRGFLRMTHEQGRTDDPSEADVILVPGYLHFHNKIRDRPDALGNNTAVANYYKSRILHNKLAMLHPIRAIRKYPPTPHVFLTPTWNPKVKQLIGLPIILRTLKQPVMATYKVAIWSLGFERNSKWQYISKEKIVPIPYVVRQPQDRSMADLSNAMEAPRTPNYVFYVGSDRPNAKAWAGCHRDGMLSPLIQRSNATHAKDMDVQLFGIRKNSAFPLTTMPEHEYNAKMRSSEFCLIMCGDTPTSRSLSAAMVSGCIPLRIGSRLRGLCDAPCKVLFGFNVTGADHPHMPYRDQIPWQDFPEIGEAEFTQSQFEELRRTFASVDRHYLRSIMKDMQGAFLYGFGDPVVSTDFGDAYTHIWESMQYELEKEGLLPWR